MRTHPKMTLRTSDDLSHCKANAVSQDNLNYYFGLMKRYYFGLIKRQLKESNYNLMDKASYIHYL